MVENYTWNIFYGILFLTLVWSKALNNKFYPDYTMNKWYGPFYYCTESFFDKISINVWFTQSFVKIQAVFLKQLNFEKITRQKLINMVHSLGEADRNIGSKNLQSKILRCKVLHFKKWRTHLKLRGVLHIRKKKF